MSTPPPYEDITGISRAVMKDNAQETLASYNGNARPGEIVVNLEVNPPTLFVGNNAGFLTQIGTGNGGGGDYSNANVIALGEAGWAGNIVPAANVTYSLGNSTHQWGELWLAGNTLYINSVPITVGANNTLTINGEAVLSNNSNTAITTTGNITADYFIGNGSLLTGIAAGTGNLEITGTMIEFAAGATEELITVSPDGFAGQAVLQLPNNATANVYDTILTNSGGNVKISTGNGVDVYDWLFDNTGNLNLPNGGAIILEGGDGVIGKEGDDLLISWDDEELVLRSVNGDIQLQADDDIEIRSGYNFGTGDYGSRWIFNNNGELQGIPQDTANSAEYNGGYIQFVGNSSGDGGGYTTLQLIPDETRVGTDQYLIIDPTEPSHIHIRAGGTQDDSAAELYLGGETNYVRVQDGTGVRLQNQTRNDTEYNYSDPGTFNTGTWYESGGTFFVQYTTSDAELIDVTFEFNNDSENTLLVYYNGGANTAVLTSAGSASNLGGGVYRVSVNEAPPASPTVVTAFDYTIWATRTNSVQLQSNDFTVSVTDDIRITGADTFSLRNTDPDSSIQIQTDYDGAEHTWEFGADGTLETPGDIIVSGDITGTAGASTLVLAAEPDSNTAIQLNDTVDSEIRTAANLAIRTDSSNTAHTWQFDVNGTLTLPEGATISNFVDQNITIGAAEINLDPAAFGASTIQMLPVTRTTADKGYNLEVLAGGVNSSGTEPGDLYLRGGVSFINSVDGGNVYITGGSGGIGAASGNVEIRTSTETDNYAWLFDNAGNLTIPGNVIMVGKLTGTGASPAPSISDFQSASFYGNVTGGNIITAGSVNVAGNVRLTGAEASDTARIFADVTGSNTSLVLEVGDDTADSIVLRHYSFAASNTIDMLTATRASNTTANVSVAGNLTATGNITATNLPTKFTGSWSVPTGNSTQSFTVDSNHTYQMWVEGNIPNGIIAWNALVTVTNNNVPVLGQQFAWNYEGGGNVLMFNSIPNQIIGTAGAISNAEPAVSNTNTFSFVINNASGNTITVDYGWMRIS